VIAAVLSFIDVPAFRRLWHFQRAAERSPGHPRGWMPRQPELWSAAAAFAGTLLFGILNAILVGVLVTLLAVLHRLSRPRVAVLGKVPGGKRHRDIHRHPDAKTREGVLIVRFEAPVFFGNADYLHRSVLRLLDDEQPHPHALVLVCDAMSDIDLTGIDALRDLITDVQLRGAEPRMCRVKGPVHDALLESHIVDLVWARALLRQRARRQEGPHSRWTTGRPRLGEARRRRHAGAGAVIWPRRCAAGPRRLASPSRRPGLCA
jgi:MFS superfamily sulfate permease-like transporter